MLLYDDAGRVVGDLALPYRIEEDDGGEPDEPPLTRPPIKPPRSPLLSRHLTQRKYSAWRSFFPTITVE